MATFHKIPDRRLFVVATQGIGDGHDNSCKGGLVH